MPIVCARSRRTARHATAHALTAVALFGSAITALAQPPSPSTLLTHPPPTIAPIPVPEVAQRAEDVATLLRSGEQGPAEGDVADVAVQLAAATDWIRGHLQSTVQTLASSPSAGALAHLTG